MNSAAIDEPRLEEPSLYQRIFGDIRDKIVSGQWEPGHRIPFEHELTVQYGCSRMTVNKALTQLVAAGLIERRRRSGSFVRRPRSQAAILEIHDIRAEVEALGLRYAYQLLTRSIRKKRTGDSSLLSPAAPQRMLDLTCLHSANESPFCLEERLVSLDTVPEAEAETFAEAAPGPWLIGRVPWSSAEHRISAAAANRQAAGALSIEEGAPCLVVERRTWSNDQPVTFARFTYPADAHTVVARFEPA